MVQRRAAFKERRAISDVVATLLLVAIVVSLGAIVFAFASSGLGSVSQNFVNLMTGSGNAISEKFVVEQVTFTTSLSTDGPTTGSFSTTNTGTVTLTTANPNDVIIVFVANEDTTNAVLRTVSTVTASGLTFTHRSYGAGVQINSSPFSDAEVWYAVATSPLAAVVITVNLSGATDDASIVALGVAGAMTGDCGSGGHSCFDSNGVLPVQGKSSSGATAPSVSGVSTSNAADIILGFSGVFDATTHAPPAQTAGAGFNLVTTQNNGGGTGKSQAAVETEGVSTTQSAVSVAFGTAVSATNAWVMAADAIVGEGADVFVRNVGTTASTLVSVYVVDQSTGAFVAQYAISTALNVGTFVDIPRITLTFNVFHGHTYSFTVTSSLGNSVIYNAKAA